MRVFYDHQVTSLQDAGGVSRYFYELVRALASTGKVEAELILGFNRSVLPFSSLRPYARVLSYTTAVRPGHARYLVNEALTTAMAPWHGTFDVYHATYQRVLPSVRRHAVVVTHHDSTTDRFPELFSNAAAIRRRLMKTYARADRVICISAASQADLLHYYDVAPERTEVIHHGFTPLPETPEAEASLLLPEQRYLLYVGARHSYKNFLAVLAALGQQKDKSLQLLVAGGGDFTAAEASAINRLGLGARVHLLARVTEHQMAAAYRGATLFVYPSLYEGFGFPPLEAMSVGCPALVSRIPALLEVCEDGAFYFDSANVEELADLIARLNFDESLRLTKKDAGFAQLRKYTWAKAGKQTLTAYRRAIDERHT